MAKFEIKKPVWGGRRVGLADHRLEKNNEVIITYRTENGELLYPGKYSIAGSKARTYPLKQFKPHMPALRMIPISDLELQRDDEQDITFTDVTMYEELEPTPEVCKCGGKLNPSLFSDDPNLKCVDCGRMYPVL